MTASRIFDGSLDHEEVIKAFREGKIASIQDLERLSKARAIECAIRAWKAEGEPDLWTFTIDEEPFALLKNPDGTCQLIMFDKEKMDAALNPSPSEGYRIRDGRIVPEWGL